MSMIVLKSTDAGAPALYGANGRLNAVLDWALVQKSWAIEFTATNARVYRAGSGNRRRLNVRHDSAITSYANNAMVRGAETATSATAVGSPFPTVAQASNIFCHWNISKTVDSTARPWRIYLSETWFYLFVEAEHDSSPGGFNMYFFGDVPTTDVADTWATLISTNNVDTAGAPDVSYSPLWSPVYSVVNGGFSKWYWCRTYDGVTKSSIAGFVCFGANAGVYFGHAENAPKARNGPNNKIEMAQIGMSCIGGTTLVVAKAITIRGYMPQLYNPLHDGWDLVTNPIVPFDTFQDTGYSASAQFEPIWGYTITNPPSPWIIFETTDTWSPP